VLRRYTEYQVAFVAGNQDKWTLVGLAVVAATWVGTPMLGQGSVVKSASEPIDAPDALDAAAAK
jgi:hypothetical protein